MLQWIDIPPFWLGIALAMAWVLDGLLPGLGFGFGWSRGLGNILILAGLATMGLAVLEFLRARTTFIPRRVPTAFLQHGIYRLTRNPIYLGDALVLAGLVLRWDVLPALLLVPLFGGFITRRYIQGEEAGLQAAFGDEYSAWAARVRRWI